MAGVRSGDYVSPNLERVSPDGAFPNMVVGDVQSSAWPYLRRSVRHNWYVDRRWPTVGFVSRDEAAIVYNTARLFDSRPCLEIGCWRGWATVHLALGTHSLDVVDPILADPDTRNELTAALNTAGVADRVTLVAGTSPAAIADIVGRTGKRWSMAFVDGDHEGDAPIRDVEMLTRHLTPDALILLHDLAAPGPAAALGYLRDHGWRTAVYQTMQMMGVATRGTCRPVPHVPDPTQEWSVPAHVSTFPIVGESPRVTLRRVVLALGGTIAAPDGEPTDDSGADRSDVETCLLTAARASQELAQARARQAQLAAEAQSVRQEAARYRESSDREAAARIVTAERETASRIAAVERETARRVEALEREAARLRQDAEVGRRFDDLHARFVRLSTALASQSVGLAAAQAELAEARGARDTAIEDARRTGAEVRRLTALLDAATRSLAGVERYRLTREALQQDTVRLRGEIDRLVGDMVLTQAAVSDLESAVATERTAAAMLRTALAMQRNIGRFARDLAQPRVLMGLARRAATGHAADVRLRLTQAFAVDGCPDPMPDDALDWLCRTRTLLGLLRRLTLAGRSATQGLIADAIRAYLGAPAEHAPAPEPRLPDVGYALTHLQRQLDGARADVAAEQGKVAAAHGQIAELEGKVATIETAMETQAQALYSAQVELVKLQKTVNGSPARMTIGTAEGR